MKFAAVFVDEGLMPVGSPPIFAVIVGVMLARQVHFCVTRQRLDVMPGQNDMTREDELELRNCSDGGVSERRVIC